MSRLRGIKDPNDIKTHAEWIENTTRHRAQISYEARKIRYDRRGILPCKPCIKKITHPESQPYTSAFVWVVVLWRVDERGIGSGFTFTSHAACVRFLNRVPQIFEDRKDI